MEEIRKKYILDHLAKVTPGDNWIRIADFELHELGGRFFFEGCRIERTHDEKFFTTRVGQRGWTKEERIQLPWKITAPRGGWKPNGGWATYTGYITTTTGEIIVDPALDPQIANEIVNAINEGNTMEHHVNRQTLVAVLTDAKVEYQDLYTRFKDLYFGVATARLSAYVEGEIPHTTPVLPCDDKGVIGILPDLADQFDEQIQMLQMDVREVLELTEDEYKQFVDHRWDNTRQLTETIGRLERLG